MTTFSAGPAIQLRDHGFADFRAGTPGDAGQNVYVSAAGVLQRIHYSCVSGSGYVDLPFANSHDDSPKVPVDLYTGLPSTGPAAHLPTYGAMAGAAADLTGDGYDDLVVANQYDGCGNEVPGQIYFGGPSGPSTKATAELWAPDSRDVAVGRFDGGRPAVVFVSRGTVRIFAQDERGFVADRFTDLPFGVEVQAITTADLDGDGCDELLARGTDGIVRVLWGRRAAPLSWDRHTALPTELSGVIEAGVGVNAAASGASQTPTAPETGPDGEVLDPVAYSRSVGSVHAEDAPTAPRLKTVPWHGRAALFCPREDRTVLLGFTADRRPVDLLTVRTGPAQSVETADLTGTGTTDLIVLDRHPGEAAPAAQQCTVYWESSQYRPDHGSGIDVHRGVDVLAVDLTGRGRPDIVVCQGAAERTYTHESPVLRTDGGALAPVETFTTHCATDILALRGPLGPARLAVVNHKAHSRFGDVATYIYLGGPDGYDQTRRLELTGWAATELRYVDLDDSGRPDVYLSNSNENDLDRPHGSFLYHATDDGIDPENRTELGTTRNMSTLVADLNRNGYLDLVTAGFSRDRLQIFPGGPDGFGDPVDVPLVIDGVTYQQPRFMSIGDLTGDGHLDLVIPELGPTGGVILLWGGPEGFDASRATVLRCGKAVSSRIADLTGDGWPDLVIGGYQGNDPGDRYRASVFVYWGSEDGFSDSRRTQLPASFPADVAVADLNGNGRLDIAVACYSAHRTRDIDSYVYWGDEDGFHPARRTRLFQHSACGLLAADFTETGRMDLAVANHKTDGNHPGDSVIWHGGPDGFAEHRTQTLPTRGPHGIFHADLGNVRDRGMVEHFTSRVHRVPDGGRLAGLEWGGLVPPKTWVSGQIRYADDEKALAAAPWLGPDGTPDTHFTDDAGGCDLQAGRFLQYRLALGAVNAVATPRIESVTMNVTVPDPRRNT
ncbi:FG-GAP repeat domain-containing protein [Streptomyces sp. NPDC058045]|uniref:FG-GAP repeat domain-containing protein n=1 Tax=Streptomyces sp. NPDC058045 TaxID=3346311 RepID=UPI0036E84A7F